MLLGKPKLYHLHIPRTGGTNILYAMQKSFGIDANMAWPGIFEFIYNHEKLKNNGFISGHFALNPILQNHEIKTFSVVREPIDHFISVAAYRAASNNKEFNNKTLDAFLEEYQLFCFSSDVFGLSGNLQTKHLTCRLINFRELFTDKDVAELKTTTGTVGNIEESIIFEEGSFPADEAELLKKIENIKLFKFYERDKINSYLHQVLNNVFGVQFCGISKNQVNSSVRNMMMPSPQQIREIENRCKMDLILYEHVCSVNK